MPSVQWINSWWWTEELPETCRVSYRSKFGKLVRLVCFIVKKFSRYVLLLHAEVGMLSQAAHIRFAVESCYCKMCHSDVRHENAAPKHPCSVTSVSGKRRHVCQSQSYLICGQITCVNVIGSRTGVLEHWFTNMRVCFLMFIFKFQKWLCSLRFAS